MMSRLVVSSLGALSLLVLAPFGHAAPSPFDGEVRAFFAQNCVSCHGSQTPEANLDLTRLKAPSRATQKVWQSIWKRLDHREMPPPSEPQPTDEARSRVTASIESAFGNIDATGPRDPGRVVVRRLNRTEYENTIRDLLGVEAPAEDFPSDDVGYGFDNIGDVLSLPPLLMEKYLAAATKIVDRAVAPRTPLAVPIEHVSGRDLSVLLGGVVNSDPPTLFTNAELYRYFDARGGQYLIRVRAAGDQQGSEPVKMAVRVDGRDLRTFDVTQSRGNPDTYELEATLPAGRRRIGLALLNATPPPLGATTSRNLIVHYLEIDGPKPPRLAELPESHRRIFIASPDEKKSASAAAREVLAAFVTRAFRRPVTEAELGPYISLWNLAYRRGEPFETALKVPLVAVLVSSRFLFRIERDAPRQDPGGVHLVDDYELASRLSYFLWSSMPDAELFADASHGLLRTVPGVEQEVLRMLRDPKARALAQNFAPQWLQTRRLRTAIPDAKLFPQFDDRLRDAMAQEPILLFDALLRENRSLTSLLDADFTFLNERLARHYGVLGVTGPEMQRVAITDAQRGGVLTMASVLTATSTPARTSPVKRGKWVLESILGAPPPPPAPDVGALRENVGDAPKVSVRERMEQHRKDPNCASCHARMDPIGFGLEHYDATGAYRENDQGVAIDDSATLPGGTTFRGASELRSLLLGRRTEFARCLTEKMLTYALGRGLEFSDAVTVREIDQAIADQGYRLSALVREIAKSYPFRYRRNLAASATTPMKTATPAREAP